MAQGANIWVEVSGHTDGDNIRIPSEVEQSIRVVNGSVNRECCDISVVRFALAFPIGDMSLSVKLNELVTLSLVLNQDRPVLACAIGK